MNRVRGIYDGSSIILLEPIPIPPNTEVEITISTEGDDAEQAYWDQLLTSGLIRSVRSRPVQADVFRPVEVRGKPLSETLIEERR